MGTGSFEPAGIFGGPAAKAGTKTQESERGFSNFFARKEKNRDICLPRFFIYLSMQKLSMTGLLYLKDRQIILTQAILPKLRHLYADQS